MIIVTAWSGFPTHTLGVYQKTQLSVNRLSYCLRPLLICISDQFMWLHSLLRGDDNHVAAAASVNKVRLRVLRVVFWNLKFTLNSSVSVELFWHQIPEPYKLWAAACSAVLWQRRTSWHPAWSDQPENQSVLLDYVKPKYTNTGYLPFIYHWIKLN